VLVHRRGYQSPALDALQTALTSGEAHRPATST
ncbi:LysR family transcriptional regulator, partial [Acidovorax sp. HMWF018]